MALQYDIVANDFRYLPISVCIHIFLLTTHGHVCTRYYIIYIDIQWHVYVCAYLYVVIHVCISYVYLHTTILMDHPGGSMGAELASSFPSRSPGGPRWSKVAVL